jgi:predicted O-methyltransferase YrrM
MTRTQFVEALPWWWRADGGVDGGSAADLQVIRALAERTEGWLSDAQGVALFQLARRPSSGEVLEIGSFCGKATLFLALGCKQGGSVTHAVDPHKAISDGGKEQYAQNFEPRVRGTLQDFQDTLDSSGLRALVDVHISTSEEARRRLREQMFKLVFIDGSHDYLDVLLDYYMWKDAILPGGYLVFHDSNFDSVAQVIADHLDHKRFRADGIIGNGGWAMTMWCRQE